MYCTVRDRPRTETGCFERLEEFAASAIHAPEFICSRGIILSFLTFYPFNGSEPHLLNHLATITASKTTVCTPQVSVNHACHPHNVLIQQYKNKA
jgi:hypothetical protein